MSPLFATGKSHMLWERFVVSVLPCILSCALASPPASARLLYGDLNNLTVKQPIDSEDFQKIKRLPIDQVDCYPGADSNLFSDPTTFRGLKDARFQFDRKQSDPSIEDSPAPQVSIKRTFHQRKHLKTNLIGDFEHQFSQLIRNYPNIRYLYIYFAGDVPTVQLSVLKDSLVTRMGLRGNFGVDHPLGSFMPKHLHEIWLAHTDLTLMDPKVETSSIKFIDIRNCKVNGSFLANLNSKSLKEMRLSDCELSDGAIEALSAMPTLRAIQLSDDQVSDATIKYWREVKKDQSATTVARIIWVANLQFLWVVS